MKTKSIFLTLLCLVLVVSAYAFEYDFSDSKLIGENNSAKGWKVISGKWVIANGMYDQTELAGQEVAKDTNAFRSIFESSWVIKDGTVTMKVKHDAKSTGANDALLLYRMVDNDNGYATRLQRDGYLTIGKITKGAYSHLKYTASPVDADKVYTVTIKLNGNNIDAYLDNKLLVSVTDASYDKGRIGLGVSRSGFPIHFLFVSAEGDGVPTGTTSVDHKGKLTTTWGDLKK